MLFDDDIVCLLREAEVKACTTMIGLLHWVSFYPTRDGSAAERRIKANIGGILGTGTAVLAPPGFSNGNKTKTKTNATTHITTVQNGRSKTYKKTSWKHALKASYNLPYVVFFKLYLERAKTLNVLPLEWDRTKRELVEACLSHYSSFALALHHLRRSQLEPIRS